LFVPCPVDELDEVLIVLVEAIVNLILGTTHAVVVLALAPQAVVLLTGRAPVVV
jgi:hypothetical protein